MNISGDLSISEFKTERYAEAVPPRNLGGGLVRKNSFLDLMKTLQGSVQKGLDETLTEIQNTFPKTEDSAIQEENVESLINEKKTESMHTQEEVESEIGKISKEGEKELWAIEEAANVVALPWFLVAEEKPNEILDSEIESTVLDGLQAEITKEASVETLESKQPTPTSKLIENLFSKEESSFDVKGETSVSLEDPKEIQSRTSKKESLVREVESKLSESNKVISEISKFNETNIKEFQENGKGFSNKEISFKGVDETKTEVSKELILDLEKWKIDKDKKTDSYANLKTSGKEEIKTAILSQFSENSSGRSGQEQSFRSGGGDSYSSLVKGIGTPTVSGRELNTLGKDFSISKETNVLSKRDIQQNFQNLIRSARVQILENGRTEASIRMNPKDLGQMSLSISTDKDVVRGKLLVESDSVKQQLVAELASLKQDLKSNGLELESLVIEVKEREEAFAFNDESDKNGKDPHSFQAAFKEDDFKNSFYEEDELSYEEISSESHGFSEKTEGKSEKLLDLKV
ncbi:flagellar hook-length control protein FliK [Leptospira mayottensis]|nr:flagellar hook-length control protein FliK [Leptospira mayottensis]AXR60731.1 flagellar hook-length control protein FliK [Leptospira mayottensis]AZQ02837.1 flagellar hook-length control protein FliK [Leptospira mayottensis 200901116]TGM95119.1 flagellar hook-length control protein FliK [Leptospira mayottensis]